MNVWFGSFLVTYRLPFREFDSGGRKLVPLSKRRFAGVAASRQAKYRKQESLSISNRLHSGGSLMCTGHSPVRLDGKTSLLLRFGALCAAVVAFLAGASGARAQGETAGGEANLK